MKIVVLVGSPHGIQGNTFKLARLVMDGARSEGGEIEVVLLDGLIQPCKGCDSCHRFGTCPLEDGFSEVRELIEEADGVLLVSPNYINSVTAQMKAFMDRCSGFIHCLSFRGKYGASVVTSGGGGDEPIIEFMNRFLMMTGIRPVGGVHASMAATTEGEFSQEVRKSAYRLGRELVLAWREQRIDSEQEMEINAFRERMRQLIVWKREEWPYEYGYWQEHHGLS